MIQAFYSRKIELLYRKMGEWQKIFQNQFFGNFAALPLEF